MLSHSDIRDYFIRIRDYIRYILYSNHLDPSILIVVLTLDPSSDPKRKRSIRAQTMRTSVPFAIRSKVVPKAGPQTKGTKKLSGYLLLRKSIPGTITGGKKTPPKTELPSKIFWIDF